MANSFKITIVKLFDYYNKLDGLFPVQIKKYYNKQFNIKTYMRQDKYFHYVNNKILQICINTQRSKIHKYALIMTNIRCCLLIAAVLSYIMYSDKLSLVLTFLWFYGTSIGFILMSKYMHSCYALKKEVTMYNNSIVKQKYYVKKVLAHMPDDLINIVNQNLFIG